jgi:hypothetical protein
MYLQRTDDSLELFFCFAWPLQAILNEGIRKNRFGKLRRSWLGFCFVSLKKTKKKKKEGELDAWLKW